MIRRLRSMNQIIHRIDVGGFTRSLPHRPCRLWTVFLCLQLAFDDTLFLSYTAPLSGPGFRWPSMYDMGLDGFGRLGHILVGEQAVEYRTCI